MSDNSEHKDVKVAKITAVQAVVVAAITAAAGVGAGYMASASGSDTGQKPAKIVWLNIEEIRATAEAAEVLTGANVRLNFNVNGVAFSFPATALWASLGDNHDGSFPLPPNEQYAVSFGAYVELRSPAGDASETVVEARSQEIVSTNASSLPLENATYTLKLRLDDFVYSGGEDALRIVYSIR